MSKHVNKFAAAVDGMDGRAERAIEFQRRYVMLCRAHGVGNHPLTKAPPRQFPMLDMTGGWFEEHKPEFLAERATLFAEFKDAERSEQWLRHVTFDESELT